MTDLTLTGKSISPKQHTTGRSYSAKSYRSPSETRQMLGRSPSLTKTRRPRPEMAVAFPKHTKPSPRRMSIDVPYVASSAEYLTFFDAPSKTNQTMKVPYSNRSSIESRQSNVRLERDRSHLGSFSKTSSKVVDRRPHSIVIPKHKPMEKEGNDIRKILPQSSPSKRTTLAATRGRLEEREVAARKIQVWYRRHAVRQKSSEAALKRILQQKKLEVEETMKEEKLRTRQRTEEEKRRQRREKAQEERQKAMAELREIRKSQEKKYRSIVDEEMAAIANRRKKQTAKKHRSARSDTTPERRSDTESSSHIVVSQESKVVQNVEEKIEKIFEETKIQPQKPLESGGDIASQDSDSIPEELPESTLGSTAGKSQGLLESLLETIQQLEAEPEQLTNIEDGNKLNEKLAWIDEMQSDHLSSISNQKPMTAHNGEMPVSNPDGGGDFVDGSAMSETSTNANTLVTKAKLSNLMNFLDDVEKQKDDYKAANSCAGRASNADGESESKKIEQLVEAEKAASEVTTELLKLRLDNEEKTRSVELLKKALSQQRQLTTKHSEEQEKEMNQRLKMQKEQYESTIQRHLSFIDQLIDDKKALHEKCERVVLEMKQAENKYQKRIRELQEAHSVEVKKQKEILTAAEKMRREKWIEEKTRTIKEMTVKGLEPEIQRLIAKHKQEVKKLKAVHEAELLQSDERAGQRYIRQTEDLREQLEREKEAVCNREREMARQRYEKQLEQEEMALQQQRRRLYAEVADEKERLNEQAARQRSDVEKLKEQLEKQNSFATSALTEEYNKSKGEVERRHLAEIETLKERLELEKQAWQETYMKKQEAYVLQKERELKNAVRHDRDAEIETVIEQLEKDMRVQREQVDKTAENRIKRIREKYESELKEIEILERQTQEKYNNMKVQYSEMEGENLQLKSLIAQKDQEVLDIKKVKDRLVEERGNVTDIIRDEFAERLVHTEEENKRMKNEVAQMRARHRLEIDRVNQEKEEELTEVHKRVKAALTKKEDSISQIKQQYEATVKRADHLEGLLETQRKQLLGKKK